MVKVTFYKGSSVPILILFLKFVSLSLVIIIIILKMVFNLCNSTPPHHHHPLISSSTVLLLSVTIRVAPGKFNVFPSFSVSADNNIITRLLLIMMMCTKGCVY